MYVFLVTHNRLYCETHGEIFPWHLQDLSVYIKKRNSNIAFLHPSSKHLGMYSNSVASFVLAGVIDH